MQQCSKYTLAMVWLAIASSSIVLVEPAPYDVLIVGLCAICFGAGLRVPSGLELPLLLMCLFIIANIVSIIFAAPSEEQPLEHLLFFSGVSIYLFLTWVFFTSLIYTDPKRVLGIIWNGYVIAAIIAVIFGLIGYFKLVPNYELFLKLGRAKGVFKDPNVFGPFLIPVALYMMIGFDKKRMGNAIVRVGIFVFMSIGILIGFSRGAWGNYFVSLLVFGLLWVIAVARTLNHYMHMFTSSVVLIAVIAVTVGIAINTQSIGEMFEKRASIVQAYDVEEGGRFSTQLAALRLILENPLGVGPNRTEASLGRTPHNVYLKVSAENGWLGGWAFITFLILTMWQGFRLCMRRNSLQLMNIVAYASFVGIVVEGFLIDTTHWRHLFLLMAMLWGVLLATQSLAAVDSNRQRVVGSALKKGVFT